MREEWKKISENPIYSVSNLGRIRNDVTNRILKPGKVGRKGNQYFAIKLPGVCAAKVHRYVAKAFIPNPDNKPEVNHIDGNHFNNNASNLEWVTGSENCYHAYRVLGRQKYYGSDSKSAKRIVRIEDGKVFGSLKDAARECGMKNHTHLSQVLHGKRHTTGGYHWRFAEEGE